MKRRSVSLILAFAMILSLFSAFPVQAAGSEMIIEDEAHGVSITLSNYLKTESRWTMDPNTGEMRYETYYVIEDYSLITLAPLEGHRIVADENYDLEELLKDYNAYAWIPYADCFWTRSGVTAREPVPAPLSGELVDIMVVPAEDVIFTYQVDRTYLICESDYDKIINGWPRKLADYTALNEVLEQVPSDEELELYTTRSVNDLKAALKQADRIFYIEDQQKLYDAVADIKKALSKLQLKTDPADYSDITFFIEEIFPHLNLDLYTEESVKVLMDAIAAVDWNLTAEDQFTVYSMSTDIYVAYDSLVLKTADDRDKDDIGPEVFLKDYIRGISVTLHAYMYEMPRSVTNPDGTPSRIRIFIVEDNSTITVAPLEGRQYVADENYDLEALMESYDEYAWMPYGDVCLYKGYRVFNRIEPTSVPLTSDTLDITISPSDDTLYPYGVDNIGVVRNIVYILCESDYKKVYGWPKGPADRSALDDVLSRVPSDEELEKYTEESVQALKYLLGLADYDFDINDQPTLDELVRYIEDALANLQLKVTPADYTAVDAALAKVPADLSVYTDASVKTLQDAVNAVDRTLTADDQDKVDAMAKAIETAIEGLVLKSTGGNTGGTGGGGGGGTVTRPGGTGSGGGGGAISSGNTSGTTSGTDTTTPGTDTTMDPNKTFKDVAAGAYYYDAVQWAVKNGITNGLTEDEFAPDGASTRAQILTFLWRASGSPKSTTTRNPFTDLDKNAYYYDAVLWAVEKGITNGYTATEFAPNETCTRAQIVTFLWRYHGQPTASGNTFADVTSGDYYEAAVIWAVANGVTNGYTATEFAPSENCTRAQSVTFLYRDLANK